MSSPSKLSPVIVGVMILWGSAVGPGGLILGTYHAKPNDAGTPQERWPADSRVRLDGSRPILLLFLHFSGGITPFRSPQGDTIGRDAVIALIADGTATRRGSPVFGCILDTPRPTLGRKVAR